MFVENSSRTSNPVPSIIRTRQWKEIVASWKSPEDVRLFAREIGITIDQLLNSRFRDKTSKLPISDGGLGTPLSGLSSAIADRFGSIRKFHSWVHNDPTLQKSLRSVCKAWQDPEEVKAFAETLGISLDNICNTDFLSRKSALSREEGGIGRSLAGLAAAIPHYFGSMSDFQRWVLGGTKRHNYPEMVASWKNREDAIEYSRELGLSLENFLNTRYLQRTAAKPLDEGGIGRTLSGLVVAIRTRFGTFSQFQEWITGSKTSPSFTKIVNDWKSPDDARIFAESVGLTIDDLTTATKLANIATIIDPITKSERKLYGLVHAVTKRFSSFESFRSWIGLENKFNYTAEVKGWNSPKDVQQFCIKFNISLEQIEDPKFLCCDSKEPITSGGLGHSLSGLYKAIRDRWGSIREFRAWLRSRPVAVSYVEVVQEWKTPADALLWASSNGVSKEQLLSSSFLSNTAKLPIEEGGVALPLSGLNRAIMRRFKSFVTFAQWIDPSTTDPRGMSGVFQSLVANWSTPAEAHSWATSKGITAEQLTSFTWLNSTAKKPIEEGGIGQSMSPLHSAIVDRFGSLSDFKVWLSGRDPRSEMEVLKELFSGPEAQALRNLAETFGEAALAEYLVAAHADKFLNYNAEFIENLRRYLGEIEQIPHASTEENLPEGIFTIERLAHLKQAVFTWYRDSYQPLFAQGLPVVTEKLETLREKSTSEYQKHFFGTLIEYFAHVDALEHPTRLRRSIADDQPFPAAHQRMAMYETTQSQRILLGDEMGGGKTGSSIASFELLRQQGDAKRCLIICPAKVVLEWKKALQDSGEKPYFAKGKAPSVTFIDSESKDWQAASSTDYTVISLEMTRGKSNGSSFVEKLQEIDFDFMIFDEAHNAKSTKRERSDTERIFAISQSSTLRQGHLMLLSGTPIPNTLRDLASHIRLLYIGTDEAPNLNLSDLQELSRNIVRSHPLLVRNLLVRKMMRRKTEDCLPVGCDYQREQVATDLNPVSKAIYSTIVDDPLLSATEKIGALRRCCLDAKFDSVCSAIDRALSDEKYTQASRPAKVVVAESAFARGVTRDRSDTRPSEEPGRETYLYSRLKNTYGDDLKVFVLDGKNSKERVAILREFHEYPRAACLLTLVSVSGEGLNITCAADGILISPTYTVSSEEQFIRRMLRFGQKLTVRLQVLCFSDTIEEGVLGYSARKHRAVGAVMDGRPLTPRERAILEDDFTAVKKNGPIAYESLTPRQQALWILSRLKGLGKEAAHKFLYADDGKYAKDFARGYPADEQTSTSGNTARLVTAIIDQLRTTHTEPPMVVADIACACRTLERVFEGSRDITVKSVDINEVALSAGAGLMKSPADTRPEEVHTMDELPFVDDSIDIGVVSLALDMTQHSRKTGHSGEERIRALLELNRTIKQGGRAILTFQEGLFPSVDEFNRFVSAIEKNFGFARCEGLSGLATAYNAVAGEKFAGWVITLEKIQAVNYNDLPIKELWTELRFPRVSREAPEYRMGPKQPAENKIGAYQDTFSIGEATLNFIPSTIGQCELVTEYRKEQLEQQRLGERVKELLETYHNIKDIPTELLLSITPEEIDRATQQERDEFYRLQIEKFGSEDQIPTNIVDEKNSYILVRRFKKLKDGEKKYYLCLAKIAKDGKAWAPSGSRYFYE